MAFDSTDLVIQLTLLQRGLKLPDRDWPTVFWSCGQIDRGPCPSVHLPNSCAAGLSSSTPISPIGAVRRSGISGRDHGLGRPKHSWRCPNVAWFSREPITQPRFAKAVHPTVRGPLQRAAQPCRKHVATVDHDHLPTSAASGIAGRRHCM